MCRILSFAARGAGIRVVLLSCKKTFPVWLKFHCENSCSKLADPQVMITGDYLLYCNCYCQERRQFARHGQLHSMGRALQLQP